MKSLHKTFDILEYVLLQNGRKITPSEVAGAISLNLASCTRIMGELVARGYLDKVSRKEGYLPGPMITALTHRDNVYERLANAAYEPVRKLSERICMPVNLSVMNGNKRIMLLFYCALQDWTPWKQVSFGNLLLYPTERLLLSALPEKEIQDFMKNFKFPLESWPEMKNKDVLLSELKKIRKAGYVCYEDAASLTVMGGLVDVPGYPPASIGFGIKEKSEKNEIISLLKKTTTEIRMKLLDSYCAY